MNVKMSNFLQNQKTDLQTLVKSLSADFPFVSILGTDTKGTTYKVKKPGASVNESIWVERGFVARVYNGSGYSEYSFNEIDDLKKIEQDIRKIVVQDVEVLDELDSGLESAVKVVEDLLSAERLIPGEYDIICDPDMAGLIAHEAFGHGVEMDMFVKNRAKAVEYLNKEVASHKVQMFDGAKSTQEVSSYLFDDEGTLGTDTQIIENGILKTGISDLLSALKLGTTPTGNGKRESFERKAYARMTNTFFGPGKDSRDDMIKSIKKGYLLENFDGGMEDPKNWGIQCVAALGREIINGELTGNVVSPVYLTGYVPDLLKNISMISDDLELSGDGMCGKGYKEFSKTSSGGPFLKTKGRLA